MYSHAAGDETCQKYFDKLKQISETKEQQLGEDQKRILLENLESQRQKLHNEAAQHIIDYAKNHLSHKKIAIAQEEARKIFEVLYYLWQDTKEDTVTFTGDEFDLLYNKNVLREFKETVKKRTGTKFHLESCVVSGFHNNDPVSNYIFTIKGQNTKSAKAEIRKIMQEIISKHKPRN
jgi:hypothetical protein